MFTGIHILEPRIFDYIPRGVFSHSVTDVYPQAMANGEIIAAHVANGTWRELSTLKRYLDISVEMLKEQGQPYVAGADCTRSRSPRRSSDAVLWDNVSIGEGARVNRSLSADDVTIPTDEVSRTRGGAARSRRGQKAPGKSTSRAIFKVKTLSFPCDTIPPPTSG